MNEKPDSRDQRDMRRSVMLYRAREALRFAIDALTCPAANTMEINYKAAFDSIDRAKELIRAAQQLPQFPTPEPDNWAEEEFRRTDT